MFCLITVLSFTILNPRPAQCQADAIVFGVELNSLLNKVNSLIQAAQNSGTLLEVGAGGQIASVIKMAQAAYENDLNLTVGAISSSEKSVLSDLQTQESYLENHIVDKLQNIADQGLEIANVIPFSKTFPQVQKYTPYFLVPLPSGQTILTIKGNFFDAAKSGYTPMLTIAGKSYSPAVLQTNELKYVIPSSSISWPNNSVGFVQAELTVPYSSSFLLIFTNREIAKFDVLMATVPSSPGSLSFTSHEQFMNHRSQTTFSQQFSQDSKDDDIPDPTANGQPWTASATPGWTIDPNSVVPVYTGRNEGDHNFVGNCSTPTTACWTLITRHHKWGGGGSGKADFKLRWNESQDFNDTRDHPSSVQLAWGDTKKFDFPIPGSWDAVYTEFDGKTIPITASGLENPYLSVQTSGGSATFLSIPN